jgi:hypothetical protein
MMSLIRNTSIHRVEIVGEYHTVQVIEKTTVKDGDLVIAESKHLRVITPLTCEGDDYTYVDTDISGESDYVKSVCAAAWTDEAKDSYRTMMTNLPHLQPRP